MPLKSKSPDFLTTALQVWELGLRPIPITRNKKHPPLVKWQEFQHRQPTKEEIEEWAKQWPEANVAILTGTPEGVDVVDLDMDDNGNLPIWPGNDHLLLTECVAQTPHGGRHYFSKHSPSFKTSVGVLAPHVDTRGEGGYVLIAPSIVDDKPYEFVMGGLSEVENPFPKWLLDNLQGETTTPIDVDQAAAIMERFTQGGVNTKYGLAALQQEIRKIESASEGERNNILNTASFAIGQLIAGGHLDPIKANEQLFLAAFGTGLTATEIQATISSGLTAGGKKPRTQTIEEKQGLKAASIGLQAFPPVVNASDWLHEELEHPGVVLKDLFDLKTKAALMGPSKSRKSFLLVQFFVSLAAGLDKFLMFEIPQPLRTLLIQLEMTEFHCHDRLKNVCAGLGVKGDQLEDRLKIINARGKHISVDDMGEIIEITKREKADIVCIDPVYKMFAGDESDQSTVKPLLAAFDLLCESTNAAFLYSHHYAKGLSGDKATVDRGSGSGILARDYDFGWYIGHHQKEGLLVCEAINRAYPPWQPFTLKWTNFHFEVDLTTAPIVQTSKNAQTSGRLGKPLTYKAVMKWFEGGLLPMAIFDKRLGDLCTARTARAFKNQLINEGRLRKKKSTSELTAGIWYIGTPAQIRDFTEERAALAYEQLKEQEETWEARDNRGGSY